MTLVPRTNHRRRFRTTLTSSLLAALALSSCDKGELEAKLSAANKAKDDAEGKVEALETAKSEAEKRAAELEAKAQELAGKQGQLESELAKKKEALEALEAVESELASRLVAEVDAGDIQVRRRHGYLVVSVSDKVLFETGKAELKDAGREVLSKLAESLLKLPKDQIFQVGGHTDNQPIKSEEVKANFPTNWELSTARATHVVRHLQENCSVPGERLVAAGFSAYRPAASNKSGKGRKLNRRIEIALLAPQQ